MCRAERGISRSGFPRISFSSEKRVPGFSLPAAPERDYIYVIGENSKFYEAAFRRLSADSEISPDLVSFV